MHAGKYLFTQLMDYIPVHIFRQCVRKHRGNYHIHSFSCYDQFLCLAFAQLTARSSLRDICTSLEPHRSKLYHLGFRGNIARSTLARANEKRSWQIYAELAGALITQARELYAGEPLDITLKQTVYAFDSTTIDLCLSLFPWAHFRKHKGAIKLHTLLDLRGCIPCVVRVSCGKMADVKALDDLLIEAGAIYLMDRGYIDFTRLYQLHNQAAFFVTRAKKNLQCRWVGRRPVDKTVGLRCDQTIKLSGSKTARAYPDQLRRIKYIDPETERRLVFLTNNFVFDAFTITKLYKCRWRVELFFKWIKQNLHIKAFYGTSENAVRTQIWIALSVYVLVAIVKKKLNIERSMTEIFRILSLSLFEKIPLFQALKTEKGNK